ncbi:MerR family transcriptional regulator [Roseibium sp.]|uniref:MerR family transcriptional regulator n=1 Tax=Roseibium sp. TaxID=1936156 RepID=UPI003B502A75
MSSQDKSPDAFRTISEVAEDLDLPQHVLRFWETRFSQIKPLKRGGGRRYYRPDDVELLKGIRHLLYGEGYTIKGVQRILKEQGQKFVMQIWREDADPLIVNQQITSSAPAPLKEETTPDETATGAMPSSSVPHDVIDDEADKPADGQGGSGFGILSRLRGEKPESAAAGPAKAISKEDIRRLQSTLFELLECKRTLDRAR